MKKTADYIKNKPIVDLSEAFAKANVDKSPFLTLLFNKNKVKKTNNIYISENIEKATTSKSTGGRKEGHQGVETVTNEYLDVDNICEIFSDTISISGTLSAISKEAQTDKLEEDIKKSLKTMNQDFEKAMFSDTDLTKENGSTGRKMKGLGKFAEEAEQVVEVENVITVDDIEDIMISLSETYSTSDTYLIIHPKDMKNLKKEYRKENNLWETVTNSELGFTFSRIVTDFGNINVFPDNNLEKGTAFLVNLDCIKVRLLRKPHLKILGTDGDYNKYQVLLEGTYIPNTNGVYKIEVKDNIEK